jgi:glycosyltransferase involved in cell wall biosynthesis
MSAGDNDIVLVAFWSSHRHYRSDYVIRAANQLARSGKSVTLVYLAGPPTPIDLDPAVRFIRPGILPATDVSVYLASGDILLAPFTDGISTRRTTLMAALQNGIPIVATDGPSTDAMLRSSGVLKLVAENEAALFADAVNCLAEDVGERLALRESGRQLFEERFDWPHLARRLLGVVSQLQRGPRSGRLQSGGSPQN